MAILSSSPFDLDRIPKWILELGSLTEDNLTLLLGPVNVLPV
jgi:hypothetical protein